MEFLRNKIKNIKIKSSKKGMAILIGVATFSVVLAFQNCAPQRFSADGTPTAGVLSVDEDTLTIAVENAKITSMTMRKFLNDFKSYSSEELEGAFAPLSVDNRNRFSSKMPIDEIMAALVKDVDSRVLGIEEDIKAGQPTNSPNVLKKYNELVDVLSRSRDVMSYLKLRSKDAALKDYIDTAVSELKSQIENILTVALPQLKAELEGKLDSSISNLKKYVDDRDSAIQGALEAKIQQSQKDMMSELATVKTDLMKEIGTVSTVANNALGLANTANASVAALAVKIDKTNEDLSNLAGKVDKEIAEVQAEINKVIVSDQNTYADVMRNWRCEETVANSGVAVTPYTGKATITESCLTAKEDVLYGVCVENYPSLCGACKDASGAVISDKTKCAYWTGLQPKDKVLLLMNIRQDLAIDSLDKRADYHARIIYGGDACDAKCLEANNTCDASALTKCGMSGLSQLQAKQIASTIDSVTDVNKNLGTLNTTVGTLGTAVADLAKQVNSIVNTELPALRTKIDNAITELDVKIAAVKKWADEINTTLSKKIVDLETKMQGKLDTLQTDLQNKITTISNVADSALASAGTANSGVKDLLDKIKATNSELETLKNKVTAEITAVQTEIEKVITSDKNTYADVMGKWSCEEAVGTAGVNAKVGSYLSGSTLTEACINKKEDVLYAVCVEKYPSLCPCKDTSGNAITKKENCTYWTGLQDKDKVLLLLNIRQELAIGLLADRSNDHAKMIYGGESCKKECIAPSNSCSATDLASCGLYGVAQIQAKQIAQTNTSVQTLNTNLSTLTVTVGTLSDQLTVVKTDLASLQNAFHAETLAVAARFNRTEAWVKSEISKLNSTMTTKFNGIVRALSGTQLASSQVAINFAPVTSLMVDAVGKKNAVYDVLMDGYSGMRTMAFDGNSPDGGARAVKYNLEKEVDAFVTSAGRLMFVAKEFFDQMAIAFDPKSNQGYDTTLRAMAEKSTSKCKQFLDMDGKGPNASLFADVFRKDPTNILFAFYLRNLATKSYYGTDPRNSLYYGSSAAIQGSVLGSALTAHIFDPRDRGDAAQMGANGKACLDELESWANTAIETLGQDTQKFSDNPVFHSAFQSMKAELDDFYRYLGALEQVMVSKDIELQFLKDNQIKVVAALMDAAIADKLYNDNLAVIKQVMKDNADGATQDSQNFRDALNAFSKKMKDTQDDLNKANGDIAYLFSQCLETSDKNATPGSTNQCSLPLDSLQYSLGVNLNVGLKAVAHVVFNEENSRNDKKGYVCHTKDGVSVTPIDQSNTLGQSLKSVVTFLGLTTVAFESGTTSSTAYSGAYPTAVNCYVHRNSGDSDHFFEFWIKGDNLNGVRYQVRSKTLDVNFNCAALNKDGVINNSDYQVRLVDKASKSCGKPDGEYLVRPLKNSYYLEDHEVDTTSFTFTGLDNKLASAGDTISYQIVFWSPLILDFMPRGVPLSTSWRISQAEFDLTDSGQTKRVGWVSGRQAAFLALDLNGNGVIDSGAELFGEATQIKATGLRAENGYKALAQYDTNHDGKIDKQDEIYSHLLLWFDDNGDGVTDYGEVKTLRQMKVSAIDLNYSSVPEELQNNAENNLKYMSKFFGPEQCGQKGCNSFDIYLNSSGIVH